MSLRFGLIGVGHFGKHYLRLLQETPGANLCAVGLRDQLAHPPALIPSHIDISDAMTIFSRQDIDCVVIATPAETHFELTQAALTHNKHVLVEKPFVTRKEDAKILAHHAAQADRIVMVGHQYLYNDYICALKRDLIQNGTLGTPQYFSATHLSYGPVRPDVGCLWEMTTHELAIIDDLFGGEITDISGVKISLNGTTDDAVSFTLRFSFGLVATITASWFTPQKVRRFTLIGSQGMVLFDDRAKKKVTWRTCIYPNSANQNGDHALFGLPEPDRALTIDAHEPLSNELKHFIECIQNKQEPRSGITHALKVTRMLDTIEQKLQTIQMPMDSTHEPG